MSTCDFPAPPAPIDLEGLQELTAGDVEFAADLVQSYVASSGELLAKIRESQACGDRQQLGRAVHQLAGASANLHAVPLRDLCSSLERATGAATMAQLERYVSDVSAELSRVIDALTNITGSPVDRA